MARIIKVKVGGKLRTAICELGYFKKFTEPLIVVMQPKGETISIHGKHALSDYINESKIPEGCEIIRIKSNTNSGVVFTDKDTLIVRIFCNGIDIIKVNKAFFSVITEVFAKMNVEVKASSHRPVANDVVFKKDGKEKKFCGSVQDFQGGYFSFFITFKFNYVDGLYKLDTKKLKERGNLKSITEVVGGINEVAPATFKVVDDIINGIAGQMQWKISKSEFTEEENKILGIKK